MGDMADWVNDDSPGEDMREPDDHDRWCATCHKQAPHRWRPSPEAGPYWRCSECGEPNPTDTDAEPITI